MGSEQMSIRFDIAIEVLQDILLVGCDILADGGSQCKTNDSCNAATKFYNFGMST